jgi:hypothetical protein
MSTPHETPSERRKAALDASRKPKELRSIRNLRFLGDVLRIL